ncbi:MAG: L,D-transpeptidase family protein [Rhizomicrobium sp.]
MSMLRKIPLDSLPALAGAAAVLMAAMGWALVFGERAAPQTMPPRIVRAQPAVVKAATPIPVTTIAAPAAEPRREPPRPVAAAPRPLPADAVAAKPLPPQTIAPDPATVAEEAGRVAARLSGKVPAELSPYFDTFIYVSKAASGPWAQRLFLFHKAADGTLAFEESFSVSTGRERSEQYFTVTPTGLFELDVHRFFPMARSAKWNDARMPWAMFLNYAYRTKMSGVALHAAIGGHERAMIGRRASGGCVRLPIAKANRLYHRFLAESRGQVPVFTFDEARGTTNTAGTAAHDPTGNIVLADGLKVLVVIENYAGRVTTPTQS